MQTTLSTTAVPVAEIGHKRHPMLLALLAALSVTSAIAITTSIVGDESSGPATREATATPSATPRHGPGSNSLSMTDTPAAAAPLFNPQHGPGSNSLSMTDAGG